MKNQNEPRIEPGRHICTECGVDDSTYWRGIRIESPVCNSCYPKRRARQRNAKPKVKAYSMWGE